MIHYDVLEMLSPRPILVEAEISLIPTASGGREKPIMSKYRPNHNFDGPDNRVFFIGQIELNEGEFLYPGESRKLIVNFLDAKGLRKKLVVGGQWRIQEAHRLVGVGVVVRLTQ